MRLFLASSLDQTISLLEKRLLKPANQCSVLFIANASDNYPDPYWTKLDQNALESIGCKIVNADLRKLTKEELEKLLNQIDIIHICGGSALYLLSLLQQKDFINLLANYIKNKKIIYTGTSAGSMIVSKDLTLAQYDDEEAEYVNKVSNFVGLGLTNFLILPHSSNPDFIKSNKESVAHTDENYTPLILINDDQVVWVDGDKFEIISVRN